MCGFRVLGFRVSGVSLGVPPKAFKICKLHPDSSIRVRLNMVLDPLEVSLCMLHILSKQEQKREGLLG